MNIVMWIVAGGVVGWASYKYLNVNAALGLVISITVGVLGGFFGGNILAPMLGASTDAPNDFSGFALFVASASAAGWLLAVDFLSKTWSR
jgi:uncharacterized membrane protein YeaQ/YmgE (transglycosylase-associated protein family)